MNVSKQQKRLLKIIEQRYASYAAYIDDDNILQIDGEAPVLLQPLLNIFQDILGLKKFTHLQPLFSAEDNFLIADMYVELAVAKLTQQADPMRLSPGMTLSDELEANHQRQTGYFGGLGENICYQIISLPNQAIEELVTNWFQQVDNSFASENKRQVLQQIHHNPQLKRMARNPFLLTLLCYIRNRSNQALPLYRCEIYAHIIQLIRKQLRHIKKQPCLFGRLEYDYLIRFSHYLYTDAVHAPKQLFNLDDWERCAVPDNPPSLEMHFLASRLLSGWRQDADYHFIHLTFQEYLIARYLAKQPFATIRHHLYQPHWRMVLRFLAGIYWIEGNKEAYAQLLKALIDPPDKAGLLYIEAAWVLVEAGLEDSTPILDKDLREILWQIICANKPYMQTAAGEALAILSPGYICEKFIDGLENNVGEDKRLAPEVSRTYLSRAAAQQIIDIGQYPKRSKKNLTIHLLGKAVANDADQILIDLFWGESDDSALLSTTISAIAEKNSPELRRAILNHANVRNVPYSQRVCELAEMTRHQAFVPWLLTQLPVTPCVDLNDYHSVFVALKAIASPGAEQQLMLLIDSHNLAHVPFELLEALAEIGTNTVKYWFTQHLNDKDPVGQRILIVAVEFGLVSSETIMKSLLENKGAVLCALIEAIGDRAEAGGKTDRCINDFIARIAFSNDENAHSAMQVITSITHQEIKANYEHIIQLPNFRTMLKEDHCHSIKQAIFILGKAKDRLSFNRLVQIAKSHFNEEVRIEALHALINFEQTHIGRLLEFFKEIIEMEKNNENTPIVEAALAALVPLDFEQMKAYLHLPVTQNIIPRVCAQQGLLLFEDYYIDPQGNRHDWVSDQKCPMLDLSLCANEQQDTLRKVCQYLLKQKIATKAGMYIKGNRIPLFRHEEKIRLQVDSIDRKTGDDFLKGSRLSADKAELLMQWVLRKFKERILSI